MALPIPRPGLVVGYDFLFREQADAGMDNPGKPHPAAIILVVRKDVQTRVSLVAISHTPGSPVGELSMARPPGVPPIPISSAFPRPAEQRFRLRLTRAECRAMGLDSRDQWINLRDINAFDWPGYDLVRSAPDGSYVYGTMSKATFARVVEALKACAGRRAISRD